MKTARSRRVILVVSIVIASIGGLLFVIEYAPVKWQVWITPDYHEYWMYRSEAYASEEAERKLRQEWLGHYSDLIEEFEPGQQWIESEKYNRSLHVDFVRAEMMRKERELKEFRERRRQPEKPSYLRFLIGRHFKTGPDSKTRLNPVH